MNDLLPKVGSYEFVCEPFHCDFSKHLFMGHLGNHMLNAADYHSNDRGFGMNYLAPRHKTWVLSRLAIEMTDMPKAYEHFTIDTWVESVMRYFTNRNFCISAECRVQGAELAAPEDNSALCTLHSALRPIGYGKSIWAMIDTETRQPQDILQIRDGDIARYINKEETVPIGPLSRVKISKEAEKCYEVKTTYCDTDYNGHINSIKYIEHILNIFSMEHYKSHFLKRLDIAYVAESYCGDVLGFYREDDADGGIMISVRKMNDLLEEEVEVVRCKVTFVKITNK